jgi:hypothetical protein
MLGSPGGSNGETASKTKRLTRIKPGISAFMAPAVVSADLQSYDSQGPLGLASELMPGTGTQQATYNV